MMPKVEKGNRFTHKDANKSVHKFQPFGNHKEPNPKTSFTTIPIMTPIEKTKQLVKRTWNWQY